MSGAFDRGLLLFSREQTSRRTVVTTRRCASISGLLARPFRITLHTYSTVWADGCGETSAETVAHHGSLVVVL